MQLFIRNKNEFLRKTWIKNITWSDNKARSDFPYITPYKSIVYHASKAYHIRFDTYSSIFYIEKGGFPFILYVI